MSFFMLKSIQLVLEKLGNIVYFLYIKEEEKIKYYENLTIANSKRKRTFTH